VISMRITTCLVSFGAICVELGAQSCTNQWRAESALSGANGDVLASAMWDPDGPGPASPVVVLGGSFSTAGNVAASCLATWNPTTEVWSQLGPILGGVAALAVLADGSLVAAGGLTSASGSPHNRIVRWNGTQWGSLGAGLSGSVSTLLVRANGELVAGGVFPGGIARWDGTAWLGLGAGLSGAVLCSAQTSNGDLLVGGSFPDGIARWDGTAWSGLGPALNGQVRALAVMPNGDVVAAGNFTVSGSPAVFNLARWDGTAWTTLGAWANAGVQSLRVLPNGNLVAGGTFDTVGSVTIRNIARWDGSSWSPLGAGIPAGSVRSLLPLPGGNLLVAGTFSSAGEINPAAGRSVRNIARWTGSAWIGMPPGFDGFVRSATALPNGGMVVGGGFGLANGVPAARVARWDGAAWSAMGSGLDGPPNALATLPNGDVVAAGGFSTAGGAAVGRVARWDGAQWLPLGTGVGGGEIVAAAVRANGDLVVGGYFTTAGGVTATAAARWDGTNWWPMGSGPGSPLRPTDVTDFAVAANGDLFACGSFFPAGGGQAQRVARWNGAQWLGLGVPRLASHMVVRPNGQILVGGSRFQPSFLTEVLIDSWNGSAWTPLATFSSAFESYSLAALTVLPNGDVFAGGRLPSNPILRWAGTTWVGAPGGQASGNGVNVLEPLANGDLLVGGAFLTAGSLSSPNLARLITTCPATVTDLGGGCAGSGGANSYTAQSLPWIGATFRARSTTIPSFAFVVVVTGFSSANLSLASLLPPSPSSCNLLVTPDSLRATVSSAGTVDVETAVPNNISLVGLTARQQLLLLEVDQNLSMVETTSSNAVVLTIGTF
jgi:trimeric autotransporter adhesin